MKFERAYSRPGDPYAGIVFEPRTSKIVNPDGSVIFEAKDCMVPADWSQVAVDVLAQKYFRKAGVPAALKRVPEEGVPEWLWRSVPDDALNAMPREEQFTRESDSRQVFNRMAGTWTYWGVKHDYFDSEEDAQIYYDEMCAMLARQIGAPNSPQWFNTGLHWAYGIEGPPQGHYFVNPKTKELQRSINAYEHPAPHACFIQSINDDLVNEGGIMDLWVREARIFKFGAGTGSNFSSLRGEGERLSGGGTSSGLMSFLRVGDRAAGAIKSGGTTRRAAKMVILDLDHPDIEEFISWKVSEEQKVSDLVAGSITCERHLNAIMRAANDEAIPEAARLDPALNPGLRKTMRAAVGAGIPQANVQYALDFAKQGYKELQIETYDTNWDSKAYGTVSGQNSNNTVRIPNEFFARLDSGQTWDLKRRTDGRISRTIPAAKLWEDVAVAAWQCADPGVQFDTTINEWHTCPSDGRINASNPCVTGDTLVATADGLHRIDALLGRSAFVIGSDGKAHFVSKIFPTGEKRVFRLRTRAGYELRLTADHKVLTEERGDVAVHDAIIGERIVLRGSGFGNRSLDESTVVALAARVGSQSLVAVGNRAATGSGIEEFIDVTGHLQFSPAIHALDQTATARLLRALFDECGEFASGSMELLWQVQLMLLSFGVKAKIYRDRGIIRIATQSRSRFARAIESGEPFERSRDVLTDEIAQIKALGVEPVYDLTEHDTAHFVANGIVVHNCSEYLFLDDTACNLASLNLVKFLDSSGRFDAKRFSDACRTWTFTLEISVLMAQFPSATIAHKSFDYRTVGLGYANLGTLLMRMGLPYDSEESFGWCGAITSLLTGTAYKTSAEMARELGPFPRYDANADGMGRVLRNHRLTAYQGQNGEFEASLRSRRSCTHRRSSRKRRGRWHARCGIIPSPSARLPAIATRRSPSSRRPVPSACSWTATPRGSSPTSRWSNSRSSPAAATSRSSTSRSNRRCAGSGTPPSKSPRSRPSPRGRTHSKEPRTSTGRRSRRKASTTMRSRRSRPGSPARSRSPSRSTGSSWATSSAARSSG